ncbi:hypothetical protein BBK82_36470 [Lentzea guizhouensis]|uniref:YCII-related domain-containing protein n=1 Tax=Lentzea guizhouensis TaxID=1586287 RepID=A0A1B2HSK6_9PSEU|nr:hypothetical protein [Lentzea guizhouensis]ANZ40682.1 hypothetical protein BBK82_36470 [Lentzea guizhouensis]
MRFLVIVRTTAELPFATLHCDALARAGVLLDAADLRPRAFDAQGRPLRPAPVRGYWLIDVRDQEEAVERVRRMPVSACVVEIRQVAVV